MAIATVLAEHVSGTAAPGSWCDRLIAALDHFNLDIGVQIFFVLSGYLITSILVQEYDAIGKIDFKAFYCRRVLRIFPPFYLFFAFILVMTALGYYDISRVDLAFAAVHLLNYAHPILLVLHQPVPDSPDYGFIGHFWTLSMEEQFYWLWPVLLLFFLRTRWYLLLAGYLVALPGLRMATYYLFPGVRGQISIMLHTGCDAIIAGCLLAIAVIRYPQIARRLRFPTWVVLSLVFYVYALDPAISRVMPRGYGLMIGSTLNVMAITLVIANVVLQKEANCYNWFLERPWLVNLGRISYSVYLWQQPFMPSGQLSLIETFPLNVVAALLAGWLSYRYVELSCLWLKDKYFSSHTRKAALAAA